MNLPHPELLVVVDAGAELPRDELLPHEDGLLPGYPLLVHRPVHEVFAHERVLSKCGGKEL